MQKIGTVCFVQVQREPMKIYHLNERIYRPDPLLKVEKLCLTSGGIVGITATQREVIDVHNEKHPQSRYRGDNKISFGFIQQHERMRERFGDHLKNGYAGENIIVDAEIDVLQFNHNRKFYIKHDDTLIELTNVIPAPPCREFSVFCLQVPQCAEDIKAALQFLSDGTRGYYAELAPPITSTYVEAGDELWMV